MSWYITKAFVLTVCRCFVFAANTMTKITQWQKEARTINKYSLFYSISFVSCRTVLPADSVGRQSAVNVGSCVAAVRVGHNSPQTACLEYDMRSYFERVVMVSLPSQDVNVANINEIHVKTLYHVFTVKKTKTFTTTIFIGQ